MFGINRQAQDKRKAKEEERRKQWMRSEIEDVFGDMMEEMGK